MESQIPASPKRELNETKLNQAQEPSVPSRLWWEAMIASCSRTQDSWLRFLTHILNTQQPELAFDALNGLAMTCQIIEKWMVSVEPLHKSNFPAAMTGAKVTIVKMLTHIFCLTFWSIGRHLATPQVLLWPLSWRTESCFRRCVPHCAKGLLGKLDPDAISFTWSCSHARYKEQVWLEPRLVDHCLTTVVDWNQPQEQGFIRGPDSLFHAVNMCKAQKGTSDAIVNKWKAMKFLNTSPIGGWLDF